MHEPKKLRSLQLMQRVLQVLIILSIGAFTVLTAQQMLDTLELYLGATVLILSLILLFILERQVDKFVTVLLAQAEYQEGDAFSALFEKSPVAYVIVDTKGVVQVSNVAAVKLLRGESSAMRGLQFYDLIADNPDVDPGVLMGKITAGLTVNEVEVPIRTISGETIWVLLSVFTYRGSGQRLISLVDVTDQKKVDMAKSEFVALATHQLRTPIAAIRWNVELLEKKLRDSKTEAQARYLNKIERNVFRMIDLINDFLSVSKLEMGTYAGEREALAVSEFFGTVLDEFAEQRTQKQITLTRSEVPVNLVIKTDRRLFHIIVSNLVSNATKYLKSGGTLDVSYRLDGAELAITIADDGIGIPEPELEKLFTKFYRASNAQSHQAEGTGLGLYIVQQSVEQLGGTISVTSRENEGATFVVKLPVTVVYTE